MLRHARTVAWRAEQAAAEGGLLPALAQLRRLGLADFADVLRAMPDPELVRLSHLLPAMPPDADENSFGGHSGKALMHDGVSFMRVVAAAFRELTGSRLQGARMLDFACGWGRLPRLMLYFSDPDRIEGAGLSTVRGAFDLIVSDAALSGRSLAGMDAAMAALRGIVAERGLLAVAVRPMEFWDFLADQGEAEAVSWREAHLRDGVAFRGDDASVDLDWFAARYPQWELRGTDRGWDELRTVLLLTPR